MAKKRSGEHLLDRTLEPGKFQIHMLGKMESIDVDVEDIKEKFEEESKEQDHMKTAIEVMKEKMRGMEKYSSFNRKMVWFLLTSIVGILIQIAYKSIT